jgi:GT2 family glycosyltransferase
VVLHFIVFEDTIDCVESILKNVKYQQYKIIIVDNGSPNESGQLLKEIYKNYNKIHVILLKKNIGFAKGNNIGYNFAKNYLGADFIILINNDTIISQVEFLEKILEKYNSTHFDILGPDIISLVDGYHQNPVRLTGFTINELIIWLIKISFLLLLNYLRIEEFLRKIARAVVKEKEKINFYFEKDQKNVQLHGCCLVFSPKFIERFDGLYSKTLMYMEEDILFYQVKKFGLISLYTPEVQIFHKEDVSTNAIFDNDYQKRRFQYKQTITSSRLLLQMMMKNDNN